MSDAACRRKLSQIKPAAEPVALQIEVTPQLIRIDACVAGQEQQFQYAVDSFPAESRGLDKATLQQVFSATADEPFRLDQLRCGSLPEIVIPPKQLKQIRREFYAELRRLRQPQRQQAQQAHLQSARAALLPQAAPRSGKRQLRVLLRDAREQRLLQDPLIDQLLLPLSGSNLQAANKLLRRAGQIIWDIPFILFDRDWSDTRNLIRQLIQAGFRNFRLNNLGHFPLFDGQQDLKLFGSFRLFSLNSQAMTAWAELGMTETELYIEDDRTNLAELLSRELPLPTALTVYASVPLITSRIAIKNVRSDHPVLSDRDDAYRVRQRQGVTWVSSETDFSFIANMNELESFGCHNFVIDLSHLGPFSQRGKLVLDALRRGTDPASTSKFNYEMGME